MDKLSQLKNTIKNYYNVNDEFAQRVITILESDGYQRADQNTGYLNSDEARPLRLQLEYAKVQSAFTENNIEKTIVVYGGTQIKDRDQSQSRYEKAKQALSLDQHNEQLQFDVKVAERIVAKSKYYDQALLLGSLVAKYSKSQTQKARTPIHVVTGGGPGVMEAANKGAYQEGEKNIGLNINLPFEQFPNPYITPELCFRFRYFALRKLHFMHKAKALVVFPGGFGTLDELFEALTVIQTKTIEPLPVILIGKDYWSNAIDFEFLALEGVINKESLQLFSMVETAQQAWSEIQSWYHQRNIEL